MFGGTTNGRSEYARFGNPTVQEVERRIAALENGEAALLYPTGMSAITKFAADRLADRCPHHPDRRLLSSHATFCARRFSNDWALRRRWCRWVIMTRWQGRFGRTRASSSVKVQLIPICASSISRASPPSPKAIRVSKPSSTRRLRRRSTIRPLEFGVDFVVHSASKYLSGHNDLLAGVVVGAAGLLHGLRQSQGILGGVLDPHTAFLLGRGLKTLALRVTRQMRRRSVAEFLEAHSAVERVWYPGLAAHPDHAVAAHK